MKQLLWMCVLSIGLCESLQAAPTNDTLCEWVLQYSTGLDLEPEVQVSTTLDDFAEAKSSAGPLRVVQYASGNPVQAIACKVSSVEGLRDYGGFDATQLGVQRTCRETHSQLLTEVAAGVTAAERAVQPESVILDEDLTAWMGPQWLAPLTPLYRDEGGAWHLQARELAVSSAWYIPLPQSIKGVHYCYLVAPDYLATVLRGEASSPD